MPPWMTVRVRGGVITIPTANITVIFNNARDGHAILPQRRAGPTVPSFLYSLSIKTYSLGRFWSESA